jgi:murein DD-endopeptidase MepM/ murein hydrolase activator NlpD
MRAGWTLALLAAWLGAAPAWASDYQCPLSPAAPVRGGDACASGGGGFTAPRKRNNGSRVPHKALDLDAKQGSDVFAIHDATVATAKESGAIGKVVILDHGDGDYSVYGHLRDLAVSAGDTVKAGDKVGEVGYTGNAKCLKENKLIAHLHFSTFRTGKTGLATGTTPLREIATTGEGAIHPKEMMGGSSCWTEKKKKAPEKKK